MLYEEIKVTNESSLPKDAGYYSVKTKEGNFSGLTFRLDFKNQWLSRVESYLLPVPPVTMEEAEKEAEALYPILMADHGNDIEFRQIDKRTAYIAGRLEQTVK